MNVPVSFHFACLLGLSVWGIYLADHLLDGYLNANDSSSKYFYFSRHRKLFSGILALLVCVNALLVWVVFNGKTLVYGLTLGVFLLIYLVFQHFLKPPHRKYFPKEVLIGLIYTLAVWFFPLINSCKVTNFSLVIMVVHFLVVLTNVLLFSYFERNEDISNSRTSSMLALSLQGLKKFILFVNGIALLLSACFLWLLQSSEVGILVVVTALYLAEIFYINSKVVRNHYAEITEGIFLTFFILAL